MKVIRVEWVDSCSAHGWSAKARSSAPDMACISVGILINEDKETLTISSSQNPNWCHSPITIPKCAIKHKKVIKL